MSDLAELLERFRASRATNWISNPPPAKWSIRQILCHMADSEAVASMHLRQLIAEENPTLHAFDSEVWAERLDYERREIEQAIETFRRLVAATTN